RYLNALENLLWPDLIIIGGGVSRKADKFLDHLTARTRIVPAQLRNDAGIVGAALAAGIDQTRPRVPSRTVPPRPPPTRPPPGRRPSRAPPGGPRPAPGHRHHPHPPPPAPPGGDPPRARPHASPCRRAAPNPTNHTHTAPEQARANTERSTHVGARRPPRHAR